MNQEKFDIFISYSRKDTAIADQICAALDSAGITYFIDRKGIGIADKFVEVIIDKIDNSRYFLLLASGNAYNARYTPKEIHYAINHKPNDSIIPYIIDNAPIPKVYEFLFSDTNYLSIDQCPIETTFIDNLLKKMGRKREKKVGEEVKVVTDTIPNLTEREKFLLSLPDDEFERFKDSGKYGFKLKYSGEIVIPPKYDYTQSFDEGLMAVNIGGYYDFKDVGTNYDFLGGKWGFVDKIGKEVVTLKYDYVYSFSEGLAAVQLKDKWGYIDKTDKEITPLKYDVVWSFNEGLAKVKLNGKYGLIDNVGREVTPLKYTVISDFSEGLARVNLNGKWGFIDKVGKEVISLRYDDVWPFNEGVAMVKLNGKYGYIDKDGKEIISLKYDVIWSFNEGLARVKLNNKWGYIDKAGKEITSLKYDVVYPFREGLAMVKLNGKYGYINKIGQEIVPFKYIDAQDFQYGMAWVKIKNIFGIEKEFYIDKNGNRIEE